MKIGVVPNPEKDVGLTYTRGVCDFLEARGHTPVVAQTDIDSICKDAEFVVVLGGDGTMLRVSHTAALYGAELFGINLGSLGFLTDAERDGGLQALDKILCGSFRREIRMMLEACGEKTSGLARRDRLALNDVCFARGGSGKVISLRIYINERYMDTLRADGVIISTPTGSTAYNLSAGGPILKPDGDMIVVTPVCPHALHVRPWVIGGNDEIKIVVDDEGKHQPAKVFLDGEARFELENGESISIKKSGAEAVILRTSPTHFYDVLRLKMGVS